MLLLDLSDSLYLSLSDSLPHRNTTLPLIDRRGSRDLLGSIDSSYWHLSPRNILQPCGEAESSFTNPYSNTGDGMEDQKAIVCPEAYGVGDRYRVAIDWSVGR